MLSLGAQSQLGIGIAVKLHDQFSATAATVNKNLLAMKKNANSAVVGAMKDYKNYALGMTAAFAGAGYLLYNAAKQGSEFQHKINQTMIVGGAAMGRTRKQLEEFAKGIASPYNPSEVAQAMFENAKAGVTQGMEKITKYQIATATATGEQLGGEGGVAEKLLGIMNAMDISSNDFGRIANAVTAAANASMASVYSLGESMQYSAFAFHKFNVPLEESLAMLAKLSQSKIYGSSAGTAINNMLIQMSKSLGPFATKKPRAAWKMLGLDMKQMAALANSGNIFGVVEAVEKASKGLSPIVKTDILNRIFNTRGDRGIEGMFSSKNGNKTLESLLAETKAGVAGDISTRQAKAMMNDLWGDFKLLGNQVQKLNIAISNNPVFRIFVGVLTKAVKVLTWVAESKVGGVLLGLGTIIITTGIAVWGFRAALMAATIGLNTLAGASSRGGFGMLLRAGVGAAGSTALNNAVPLGLQGLISINKRGNAYVAAGKTATIGGKLFKAGQIVPKSVLGSAAGSLGANLAGGGLAGVAQGVAGNFVTKGAGFFGKALPFLSTAGSLLARWLPVIGLGITAWQIATMKSPNEDAIEEGDPAKIAMIKYRNLQRALREMEDRNPTWARDNDRMEKLTGTSMRKQMMEATINLNLNGKTETQKVSLDMMNKGLENQIDFNTSF